MTINSTIIQNAVRRSLQDGMLTAQDALNTAQIEALESYAGFLNESADPNRAYVDMATGTGKTGLFSVMVRHAHQIAAEQGFGGDFRTVIVEPTLPLIRQTQEKLIAAAPELKGAIGLFGDREKDLSKPISIVTYDAWLGLLESGQLNSSNVNFHIPDEAHHSLSERRRGLFDEKLAGAMHFGVTASAQYDAEKSVELTLRNRIYKLDLPDAIERSFLTDYAHIQYYVMRILPDMLKNKQVDLSNGDFTLIKRLEWAKLITRVYADMVDGISGQPLSDKIGMIFAADTRAADGMAARLNENPVLKRKAQERGFKDVAVSIHSVGHSSAVQDSLQDQYQNGEYMVAVGDKKFQAGFDHPAVKFVAPYPGASPVEAIQEIGRATRKYTDPRTGQSQGTVIIEAIPYIGDADPKKDEKARREALAKVVTAYQILGRSLVFAPGRKPVLPPSNARSKGNKGGHFILSPQCEVDTFITEEDTLTISRQIGAARNYTRNLTEEQILHWVTATHEKTGKLPVADDPIIWTRNDNGDFELIEDETWRAVDTALKTKGRGLQKSDGSAIAASLYDLKQKHDLDKILTVQKIISWMKATEEKTGKLPLRGDEAIWSKNDNGGFELIENETWAKINYALHNGRKGLINSDGTIIADSLTDFKIKYGVVDARLLSERQIIEWLLATHEKNGHPVKRRDKIVWSKDAKGNFEIVSGENWIAIDQALRDGQRGLVCEDGSPIANSLHGLKNKNDLVDQPTLLKSTERTTSGIGKVLKPAAQEIGKLTNDILGHAEHDLKKRHGLNQNSRLDEGHIVKWIKDTYEKTGKIPGAKDKDVWAKDALGQFTLVEGETWRAIDHALTRRHRGLTNEDETFIARSLMGLKIKHGLDYSKLTEDQILEWISATFEKTGKYPSKATHTPVWTRQNGGLSVVDGEQWAAIDKAIKYGYRRLVKSDGSKIAAGLADLKRKHGFVDEPASNVKPSPKQNDAIILPSPPSILVDPAEIARKTVTDLFAELSGKLLADVSMIVEQLRPQPVPTVEDAPSVAVELPRQKRKYTKRTAVKTEAESSPKSGAVVFNAPLFEAKDNAGINMQTCLVNAERAASYEDLIGVRGNLQKFAELLIHHSMLGMQQFLANLEIEANTRKGIEDTIKQYRNDFASRTAQTDSLASFRKVAVDLKDHPSGALPSSIYFGLRKLSNVAANSSTELLDIAFQIAQWFDASFCRKVELSATAKAEPDLKPQAIIEHIKQPETVVIPASMLKVLGLTAEQMDAVKDTNAGQIITHFVEHLAEEPPAIKQTRNAHAQMAYQAVAPVVKDMVGNGKNIQEVIDELNRLEDMSASVREPTQWRVGLLLRGVVLNRGSLPFSAFELERPTQSRMRNDRKNKL